MTGAAEAFQLLADAYGRAARMVAGVDSRLADLFRVQAAYYGNRARVADQAVRDEGGEGS